MKVRIDMKTPDCLDYATEDLSEEEREEIKKLASRWFRYEECVTLELDTETQTLVAVR